MDNQLFGKVCELEALLELANNRAWLMQGLVQQAFDIGLKQDNEAWQAAAKQALGRSKNGYV
jgi:hypothetical protein